MSQAVDRVKLRQEYLKKKGRVYGTIAGTGISLIAILTSIDRFITRSYIDTPLIQSTKRGTVIIDSLEIFVIFSVVIVLGLFALALGATLVEKTREAAHIPVVPPITLDSLPAEEVLVRGSEEPQQPQSQILLRVADAGEQMQASELLRSSQEGAQR